MKIAMLSYNAILPSKQSGWVSDSLYMIQNDSGKTWFEEQVKRGGFYRVDENHNQIPTPVPQYNWHQLANLLPDFDAVVIYVGANGSEVAIKCAAESELPSEKTIFVMCNCNALGKRQLLIEAGFNRSKIVYSECTGIDTMARIAETFLETGNLVI